MCTLGQCFVLDPGSTLVYISTPFDVKSQLKNTATTRLPEHVYTTLCESSSLFNIRIAREKEGYSKRFYRG